MRIPEFLRRLFDRRPTAQHIRSERWLFQDAQVYLLSCPIATDQDGEGFPPTRYVVVSESWCEHETAVFPLTPEGGHPTPPDDLHDHVVHRYRGLGYDRAIESMGYRLLPSIAVPIPPPPPPTKEEVEEFNKQLQLRRQEQLKSLERLRESLAGMGMSLRGLDEDIDEDMNTNTGDYPFH